ncbi:Fungal specific transcription factor domain containing protein [Naviculisporaceae sp. PSN 640]
MVIDDNEVYVNTRDRTTSSFRGAAQEVVVSMSPTQSANKQLASRSTQGCWTCRLRKKKCDENHPSCFRCTSLQIACDGYGPRPYWMDRGDLQREQARYKKHIIAQIKSAMRGENNGPLPSGTDISSQNLQQNHHDGASLVARQASMATAVVSPIHQLHHTPTSHPASSATTLWSEALNVTTDFSATAAHLLYDPSQTLGMPPEQYDLSSSTTTSTAPQTIIMRIAEGGAIPANSSGSGSISGSSSAVDANMADPMDLVCDGGATGEMLSEYCSAASERGSGYSSSEADWFLGPQEPAAEQYPSPAASTDPFPMPTTLPTALENTSNTRKTINTNRNNSKGNNVPSPHPILHGDMEDILFMYYFDHVFYMHCPFYFPSHRQGRGWLLSILKRVNSAYHAALALSEHHHSISSSSSSSSTSGTSLSPVDGKLAAAERGGGKRGGHYDLAVQELQISLARSSAWSGNMGLTHNVEVLTTILHLLFYESSTGGKNNWQIHLGGANALLPSLVQAHMGWSASSSASTSAATAQALRKDSLQLTKELQQQEQQHQQPDSKPPNRDTSISFLLGFFIHMHILTCASTRSSQYLNPDHKLLLETGEINLEDLVGCSNWAMILIYEISALDKWKKEEEAAHRLSLIELTKRGREIEDRLLSRIASLEKSLCSQLKAADINAPFTDLHHQQGAGVPHARHLDNNHNNNNNNNNMSLIKMQITRIFALSAITYLHVVISGAYPDIPDIKRSVSKTLAALQELRRSDPKLLRHVVWPYCISGCLAADDAQQKVFRELVADTRVTHGTCFEALAVMEECWRARRKGSRNGGKGLGGAGGTGTGTTGECLDWAAVMERRAQFVLLT